MDDESYTYDALGNLLTKAGVVYSYGANGDGTGAGPHQARTVGGQPYTYDAHGNLLSGGGRSYAWNVDNQPISITGSDGVQETYAYDADGLRVGRTRGGVTTLYHGGLFEEDVPGSGTRTYYTFNGQVIAQRDGSEAVLYLHGDHLGSVAVATNASGAVTSRQTFSPWGEVRNGGIRQTSWSDNRAARRLAWSR